LSGGYLWSNGSTARSITVSASGIYTVRSYNAGGCFSTSLPSTVTVLQARKAADEVTEADNVHMNVFPNPAQEELNVVFSTTEIKTFNVKLLDITGRTIEDRIVESVSGENKVQFDISALPGGIYFAWVMGDNQKEMLKVVVDHTSK
jgi:hypothetical protein